MDPNAPGKVESNRQMAAENSKKRVEHKKQKKSQASRKDAGKAIGKGLKSLKRMF
jgi:hypothetical protein